MNVCFLCHSFPLHNPLRISLHVQRTCRPSRSFFTFPFHVHQSKSKFSNNLKVFLSFFLKQISRRALKFLLRHNINLILYRQAVEERNKDTTRHYGLSKERQGIKEKVPKEGRERIVGWREREKLFHFIQFT